MDPLAITVLLLVVLILVWVACNRQSYAVIRDSFSGSAWNLSPDYDNAKQAAEQLSRVNVSMMQLFEHLRAKYRMYNVDTSEPSPLAPPGSDKYNIIQSVLTKYNPEEFYENDPRKSDQTSYTVGKSIMYICMRDKDDPTRLVAENDLLFVILHEAAHMANYNDHGHSPRFWRIFKFLLEEAVESGMYRPVNYTKTPSKYCGITIDYSPLHDSSLRAI